MITDKKARKDVNKIIKYCRDHTTVCDGCAIEDFCRECQRAKIFEECDEYKEK